MDDAIEKSAMRKIYMRLLPFAIFTYFLAYVDRINVSFAGLTMQGDLKMSATAFGFAAGTFYWGYFIFEVPSNVIMEKVGARLWIARIMITWGIFAGITATVTGSTSFGIIRFFLGVAEAGFFPGIILYFTYWFPSYHHARIVSGFLIGLPIAVAAGAPISTGILALDGLFGLHGWQVMYIAEAIPTVLIGVVTLFVLTDRPEQARFLTPEEKTWLSTKLAAERKAKEAVKTFGMWQSMFDPKVLLLSLNYFGIVVASLGLLIFVPQIIKSIGVGSSNMTVGWLTMIPYTCGAISLVIWGTGLRSDAGEAVEPARGLPGVGDRAVHRRLHHGNVVVVDRDVDRDDGFLWLEGPILGDAADVPHRHCRRGLDRVDQLDRQSRRVLWSLVCRRDEGPQRQLRRRPVWPGPAVPGVGDCLRLLPEHSEPRRREGGGGRGSSRLTPRPRAFTIATAHVTLSTGQEIGRPNRTGRP